MRSLPERSRQPNYIHMSNEETKIYDMVVRRFLAVMYPAYEYEESVLTGAVEGEHFYARGTRPLHMGWKAVYENQSEDEEEEELKRQNLPVMTKRAGIFYLQYPPDRR